MNAIKKVSSSWGTDREQLISKASITFCFMATFVCSSYNWLISLLKVWDLLLFLTRRARALSSSLRSQTSRISLVCCFVVQRWNLRPVCVRQAIYTSSHGPMAFFIAVVWLIDTFGCVKGILKANAWSRRDAYRGDICLQKLTMTYLRARFRITGLKYYTGQWCTMFEVRTPH